MHILFNSKRKSTVFDLHFFFKKDFIYIFREKGKEEERSQFSGLRTQSIGFLHTPNWGPGLQLGHILASNWTGDLLLCGVIPNPLSHTSQGCPHFYLRNRHSQAVTFPPMVIRSWLKGQALDFPVPMFYLAHRRLTLPSSHLSERAAFDNTTQWQMQRLLVSMPLKLVLCSTALCGRESHDILQFKTHAAVWSSVSAGTGSALSETLQGDWSARELGC